MLDFNTAQAQHTHIDTHVHTPFAANRDKPNVYKYAHVYIAYLLYVGARDDGRMMDERPTNDGRMMDK